MKRFWLFIICAALAPSLANAACGATGCALVRVVQVYVEANAICTFRLTAMRSWRTVYRIPGRTSSCRVMQRSSARSMS